MGLIVNTSETEGGCGTMNAQQSLVDGSFVCQTSQFKLVEKSGCCERL